jgi:hypothetical protein
VQKKWKKKFHSSSGPAMVMRVPSGSSFRTVFAGCVEYTLLLMLRIQSHPRAGCQQLNRAALESHISARECGDGIPVGNRHKDTHSV